MVGGPLGAALGGGIGAALGNEPVSLEDALRELFRRRNLEFVSLRSTSTTSVTALYKDGETFRGVYATAPNSTSVDDDLYDAIVTELNKRYPSNVPVSP